jgi:hypothetical protein
MNPALKNQQILTILNVFFQSVAEKNLETIASFFSDDVDWYIPKSDLLPWTGKLTKKSEIAKALNYYLMPM